MPKAGFGVYQVNKEECERVVLDAIKAGYRLIDTAQSYFNEEEVGNAIEKAINDGLVKREELFITSKVWIDNYGYEKCNVFNAQFEAQKNMEQFGVQIEAWGGIQDYGRIYVSLSQHKTTDNLKLKKAFTVSFATKDTELISDYFGVVSGNKEDKIAKAGVHITKSNFVDAPIIEEYPLTLECEMESFEDGILVGKVVNSSIDENYLDENGKIDVEKMQIIAFDMVSNTYRLLGDVVGNAFKDGLDMK